MNSYDYGQSFRHDHDRRIFATMDDYYRTAPKGYRRRDSGIKDEVCELLKWDPDVDATEVEVSVENGVVTLRGTVDSRHAKRRAERALDHVFGVLDVQNQLGVNALLDLEPEKAISRGEDGLFTQEIRPT